VAGTVAGEGADQPLDRLGQAPAALVEAGLVGQLLEQGAQSPLCDGKELAVGGDIHHRLGDAEGGDLRVGQASTGVLLPFGQAKSAVQNTAVSSRSRSASIVALLGSGCD